MTVQGVEEKVREILLQILDVEEEAVVSSATLINDLHATSIDLVEILTAFQNTFGVSIDEEQALKFTTIQDAVDFLKSAISQKDATS